MDNTKNEKIVSEGKCSNCGVLTSDNVFDCKEMFPRDPSLWVYPTTYSCNACSERTSKIIKWQNEKVGQNRIICPHCEYEYEDSWEYDDCGEDEIECGNCGKIFELQVNVTTTYSTQKRSEDYDEDIDKETYLFDDEDDE